MYKVTENNFPVQSFDDLRKATELTETLQKANPQNHYEIVKRGIF